MGGVLWSASMWTPLHLQCALGPPFRGLLDCFRRWRSYWHFHVARTSNETVRFYILNTYISWDWDTSVSRASSPCPLSYL